MLAVGAVQLIPSGLKVFFRRAGSTGLRWAVPQEIPDRGANLVYARRSLVETGGLDCDRSEIDSRQGANRRRLV